MSTSQPMPIPLSDATGAGHGLQWWSSALAWLFGDVSRLGVWVGMTLGYVLIVGAVQFLPLVGSLASGLLYFTLAGGLMEAARKTALGTAPPFGDLFGGFGAQAGALIGAALLVLVASLAVFALMLAVGAGALVSSIVSVSRAGSIALDPSAWSIGLGSLGLMLLCLALFVPISMAAWFAPALIMLRGAAPADALRASLAACRRNLAALTVYGLVFVPLALLATVMLGLGWLFLVPLLFLSTYAAFEDLFPGGAELPG